MEGLLNGQILKIIGYMGVGSTISIPLIIKQIHWIKSPWLQVVVEDVGLGRNSSYDENNPRLGD
jgi:hypothetical protein